jgi:hypothetical protein
MTKTKTAAKDTTLPTRRRRLRTTPVPAERRPTTTLDDALYEMRVAHQRWELLMRLAAVLDDSYGPGDRDDPPLPLHSPTGGEEPPIRVVVDELRLALLQASARAHARYKRLVTAPIDVKLEPVEPVFDVESSA